MVVRIIVTNNIHVLCTKTDYLSYFILEINFLTLLLYSKQNFPEVKQNEISLV